jgi:hypothetical protein
MWYFKLVVDIFVANYCGRRGRKTRAQALLLGSNIVRHIGK